MDNLQKEMALIDALGQVLERHTQEYDLTLAQVLGVLEMVKYNVVEQHPKG